MTAGVTLGEVTHFRRPPPGRFVMADGLTNNKSKELLDKVRVKLADSRESTQTTYLLGFSSGIARRQSVLSLQFANYASAREPFRQHVNDRGVNVVDAIAHGS